ncbi:MAG: S24/S26 family peptidase [Proteobacteria bacterium]|nr:S24/S26 family peptidase [Pseudomonadota bacterium]MBU4357183.1 S24/S26 family peptidase [Pseudomonadota bacterium]MBU4447351.1 S24/S26 family peptidase [Pseudomonadota bacterium]
MRSNQQKPCFYGVHGGVASLSGPTLRDLLQALMARKAQFRFKARGFSMHPFIRDGDVITVSPKPARHSQAGDVVAFCHPEMSKLLVHRVIARRHQGLLLQGDNVLEPDGLISFDNILGLLTKVTRNGHQVRLGLGPERRLIAWLNYRGWLNPVIKWSGAVLWPFLKGWKT